MMTPGETQETAPGALPCAAKIHRYMHGDCMDLALAVQELTGWTVVAVSTEFDSGHAMTRTPDGRFLDAEGLHDPIEIFGVYAEMEYGALDPFWRGYQAALGSDVIYDADELLTLNGW